VSDLRAISYEDCIALTPSNTTQFAKPYGGFIAGVAGNVQITTLRNRVTVIPVLAGLIYPIPFLILWATNTTATGIIGLAGGTAYLGPN
jgi:hypothetical protein